MRLIDADELLSDRRKTKYYHLSNKDIAVPIIDIEHAHTVNAIPIPDGATNRDVIREIWHDETLLSNIEYCYGEEWLNAPYNPPKQNLAPADKSGLEYADQPTLQSAT